MDGPRAKTKMVGCEIEQRWFDGQVLDLIATENTNLFKNERIAVCVFSFLVFEALVDHLRWVRLCQEDAFRLLSGAFLETAESLSSARSIPVPGAVGPWLDRVLSLVAKDRALKS